MPNHPIYEKAKAQVEATGRAAYVDTADVAKLVRSRLKSVFPKTAFRVRISRYAGGSSTRIGWEDGPTSSMVDAIVSPYRGGGFDGMIDMAYDSEAFLMPDGSAAFAETSGTEGSMGMVPSARAFKPHPDAIRVRFSGRYVFTEREFSKAALERLLQSYAHRHADELAAAIRDGRVTVKQSGTFGAYVDGANGIRVGDTYGDSVLHRYRVNRMIAA